MLKSKLQLVTLEAREVPAVLDFTSTYRPLEFEFNGVSHYSGSSDDYSESEISIHIAKGTFNYTAPDKGQSDIIHVTGYGNGVTYTDRGAFPYRTGYLGQGAFRDENGDLVTSKLFVSKELVTTGGGSYIHSLTPRRFDGKFDVSKYDFEYSEFGRVVDFRGYQIIRGTLSQPGAAQTDIKLIGPVVVNPAGDGTVTIQFSAEVTGALMKAATHTTPAAVTRVSWINSGGGSEYLDVPIYWNSGKIDVTISGVTIQSSNTPVIVQVDANNQVEESNESDNTISSQPNQTVLPVLPPAFPPVVPPAIPPIVTPVVPPPVPPPTVIFSPATFDQTQYSATVVNGSAVVTFSVNRTGLVSVPVSVTYSAYLLDGTPVEGTAYSGTLQWAANDLTSRTITIPVSKDEVPPGESSYYLVLTNATTPSGPVQSLAVSTLTIHNDGATVPPVVVPPVVPPVAPPVAPPIVPPSTTATTSTTTLELSKTQFQMSEAVTLTAKMQLANGQKAMGNVVFSHNGVVIGNAAVDSSGNAALTTNQLRIGRHQIIATFTATTPSTVRGSVSSAVSVQVASAATTTTVTATGPTISGGPSILEARVRTIAGATAIGTVTFRNGSTILGTAQLNGNGIARLSSVLPVGTYSIQASYSGSSTALASLSSATALNVVPIAVIVPTTTQLSVSADTIVTKQQIVLQARVNIASTGVPVASGQVQFYDGSKLIGSIIMNGTGVASFTTTTGSVGPHDYRAVFVGSSSHRTSTSVKTVSVVKPTTVVAFVSPPVVSSSPSPATVAVRVTSPFGGSPIGSVDLFVNNVKVNSSAVNGNGIAQMVFPNGYSQNLGTVRLVYNGSSTFAGSQLTRTI